MKRHAPQPHPDRTSTRDADSPERGTTLAELAVGLLVSSLVLASSYGAYRFAARGAALWQNRQQAASADFLLQRRIADDVRASARIVVGPGTLTLIGTGGDTTALYALAGGVLIRNERATVPASALSAWQEKDRVVVTIEGDRPIQVEARLRGAGVSEWLPVTAEQDDPPPATAFPTPPPLP